MEILVGLALYLIPALVAGTRRHHQVTAITLTNLLLGWTVIGWVVALIWSVSAVHPERRSARQQRQMARWEHTKSQAPLSRAWLTDELADLKATWRRQDSKSKQERPSTYLSSPKQERPRARRHLPLLDPSDPYMPQWLRRRLENR